jgi:hypothetical protein
MFGQFQNPGMSWESQTGIFSETRAVLIYFGRFRTVSDGFWWLLRGDSSSGMTGLGGTAGIFQNVPRNLGQKVDNMALKF